MASEKDRTVRAFRDSCGREWEIKLTIGSASRVYDKVGVNILGGGQSGVNDLTALYTDSIVCGKVIACLLEKQAKEKGIDDFLETLEASDFAKAKDAFLEELENFFLASRREDMTAACRVLKKVVEDQVQATVENLRKQFGEVSGKSQDKSG